MKRFLLVMFVALAMPAAALAKGASQATIEGPGFHGAIVIPGDGEDGGNSTLGRLAELGGFYPAVFLRTPNPMLASAPSRELGLATRSATSCQGRPATASSGRTSTRTPSRYP